MSILADNGLDVQLSGYIGRGVSSVEMDAAGNLIFHMSDGQAVNLGPVPVTTDGTLSQPGQAADAKAAGDQIAAAQQAAASAQTRAENAAQLASAAGQEALEAGQAASKALPKSGGTITGTLNVEGTLETKEWISAGDGMYILSPTGSEPGEGVAINAYYDSDGVPTMEILGSVGDETVRVLGVYSDSAPVRGVDYWTEADQSAIISAVKAALDRETWTFTLADGTTVTREVAIL